MEDSQRHKLKSRALSLLGTSTTLVVLTGCGLFKEDAKQTAEEAAEAACAETLTYLEETAWPTVLGTNCADCHTPGGPAMSEGSDFALLPPGYPNFQQRNLET